MQLSPERILQLNDFCEKYDLKFNDLELLNRAFCHTSYTNNMNLKRFESYERLEFYGDAVLKLAASDIVYNVYENEDEGYLTKARNSMVSDETIGTLAKKINLGDLILAGKSLTDDSKTSSTILSCAFEALLGAIYIEYKDDGYLRAKKFIYDNFLDELLEVDINCPKCALQELTQKIDHTKPEYRVIEEKGPSHDKVFVIGVYHNEKLLAQASAKSKKAAETLAAKEAFSILNKETE